MPYQPSGLSLQLEGMQPLLQLGGNQSVYQTPAGVPFIYGATSQPGPVDMGNQIANAITQVLAPLVARMTGMQNPQFAPNIGSVQSGMTPWVGYYMRDVQRPLYESSRDQYLYGWAGQFGSMAGDLVNGIAGRAVMTDQQRQQLADMVQSPLGRTGTGVLLGLSGVQGLVGGNAMQMFDMIYGNRSAMRGNVAMAPMDIESQINLSKQTTGYITELTSRMVGQDGLPNYAFTRGFKFEDFGQISNFLTRRGAADFTGMAAAGQEVDWNRARVETTGKAAKALEAISELVGGAPTEQLLTALDKLTQGVSKFDATALERVTRQVQSLSMSAKTFGVSGQMAMEAVEGFQSNLRYGLGISPAHQALGLTAGGYDSFGVANQLAITAMASVNAAGRQGDPAFLARTVAAQSTLLNVGMQSGGGFNAQAMGWLASVGDISPDEWNLYAKAVQAGDLGTAEGLTNRALSKRFGTAEAGRAILSNARQMMLDQTDDTYAMAVTGIVQEGLTQSLGRNVADYTLRDAHRRAMLGIRQNQIADNPETVARTGAESLLNQLVISTAGTGSAADIALAQQARDYYDKQLETGTPQQAYQNLRQYMRSTRAMDPFSEEAFRSADQGTRMAEILNYTRAMGTNDPNSLAAGAGAIAFDRMNRLNNENIATRLIPREQLAGQTALYNLLQQASTGDATAVASAQDFIGKTRILTDAERAHMAEVLKSGDKDSINALISQENAIRQSMHTGVLRLTGESGLGSAWSTANLMQEGMRTTTNLTQSLRFQTIQAAKFDDLLQHMRKPFGQRLWSTVAGDMTLAEAVGIEDMALRSVLREDYDVVTGARKNLTDAKGEMDLVSGEALQLISQKEIENTKGASESIHTTSKQVQESVKANGDTAATIAIGANALTQLGVPAEQVAAARKIWEKQAEAAKKATKAAEALDKTLTPEMAKKLELEQRAQKYRDRNIESDARRRLKEAGVDLAEDRGIFVEDIGISELTAEQRRDVESKFRTILGADQTKDMTTRQMRKAVADLSGEDFEKMKAGPNWAKQVKALADLTTYIDDPTGKKPDSKSKELGRGSEKTRVDLVGTLTVYNREGVDVGVITQIHNKNSL